MSLPVSKQPSDCRITNPWLLKFGFPVFFLFMPIDSETIAEGPALAQPETISSNANGTAVSQASFINANPKATEASFRVDTDIYVDPKGKPIKHTLTLFSQGIYYDFEDGELGRVTVIDPKRQRIVLIDRAKKTKLTLSTSEILSTVAQAKSQADAKLTGVTRQDFQPNPADPSTSIASIANEVMEYRAICPNAGRPEMAMLYNDFANWSARLNSIDGLIPPYLRIELNDLVQSKATLPQEIVRTANHNGRTSKLICQLQILDRLSEDDRNRIARVGSMLAEYQAIKIEQHLADRK